MDLLKAGFEHVCHLINYSLRGFFPEYPLKDALVAVYAAKDAAPARLHCAHWILLAVQPRGVVSLYVIQMPGREWQLVKVLYELPSWIYIYPSVFFVCNPSDLFKLSSKDYVFYGQFTLPEDSYVEWGIGKAFFRHSGRMSSAAHKDSV